VAKKAECWLSFKWYPEDYLSERVSGLETLPRANKNWAWYWRREDSHAIDLLLKKYGCLSQLGNTLVTASWWSKVKPHSWNLFSRGQIAWCFCPSGSVWCLKTPNWATKRQTRAGMDCILVQNGQIDLKGQTLLSARSYSVAVRALFKRITPLTI